MIRVLDYTTCIMQQEEERRISEADVSSSQVKNESDGPSEIFEPVEFLHKVKSFWKTRTAILNNLPIYDYTTPQLIQQDFMNAWKFNLTQSAIAALPGTTYVSLKKFIFERGTSESIAGKLFEISHPLLIPFILTATAYIMGRLSLRTEDFTKDKRKRASRIFLYLDGAYGFYPQLLMSCFAPFGSPDPDHLFAFVAFSLISGWTLILYLVFLPESLFGALGYRVLGLGDVRPSPPTVRYRVAIFIVVPLVISALTGAFKILAVLLALLIQSLAARFHIQL